MQSVSVKTSQFCKIKKESTHQSRQTSNLAGWELLDGDSHGVVDVLDTQVIEKLQEQSVDVLRHRIRMRELLASLNGAV